MKPHHLALSLTIALAAWLGAALTPATAQKEVKFHQQLAKGLELLKQGAIATTEARACFTCHSHSMPVVAHALADQKGFLMDTAWRDAQLAESRPWLESRRRRMVEGRGVPGSATTIGYELMMEQASGAQSSPLIEDMLTYLFKTQRDDGSWSGGGKRPPTEGSVFTSTTLAIQGLRFYAPNRPDTKAATEKAREWLSIAVPQDTEDLVFRLWGRLAVGARKKEVSQAKRELIAEQRADGGWAQTKELDSDAYATGTALFVLHKAGMGARNAVYKKGVKYLLETQAEDGTWRVAKRAVPIQKHFETGFPYGKDQFISAVATAWADMALLHTLPDTAK